MPDSRARALALLGEMTLEEKVAQLGSMVPTALFGADGFRRDSAAARLANGIGYFEPHSGGFPATAADLARMNNQLQRYLIEETRLRIPAIMHVEALNGINAPTFTIFPTAIALAATWQPGLIRQMTDLTRRQMRAVGLHHALSPVLDVARDARWGRVHETYGEDPYLISSMGVDFVRGLQGDDLRDGVIATGKHFLGYATSQGGLNTASASFSPRDLLEVHARPFHAAIDLAGLRCVMNSLSEWDGVPAVADPRLFRDLLRERLGFEGTVVADWSSIANLVTHHRVASDATQAGVLALTAGIDAELPDVFAYGDTLVEAVRDGLVSEQLVDESVVHILTDKFDLGLFENPYVDEDPIRITELALEGADLSEQLARTSITLLKNDNQVLPLRTSNLKVALVGPHASIVDAAFPAYTYPAFVDLTRAIMAGMASSMVGVDDSTANGALAAFGSDGAFAGQEVGRLLAMTPETFVREQYGAVSLAEALRSLAPDIEFSVVDGCGLLEGTQGIGDAVAAAEEADVVVLALGGQARWFFADRTEGEGADSSDLRLPEAQRQLARAVAAVGKPSVAVIFAGRPFALGDVADQFDAILFGYFGGPFGTRATAEVLLGLIDPQGRLPYTVPRSTGQVPIHAGQRFGSGYRRPAGDPMGGYTDSPATPLYAFGHGLSYTEFEYLALEISSPSVPTDGQVAVRVSLRNVGPRRGTEVVQLYVEDTATGICLPAQQLVGLHAISLDPGEGATVEFDLAVPTLAYLGRAGEWIMEPGPIEIRVGSSSDSVKLTTVVQVTGDAFRLPGTRPHLTASRRLPDVGTGVEGVAERSRPCR